jgi:restriction endonuclease S subunit
VPGSQYLQVILNSPLFSGQVIAMLSGSAQSQLPINKLSRITFLLPSTEKQTQIVRELDRFQASVDAVRRLQVEASVELDAL